jgi:uncharacterized protein YdeI (YjbR/CyaY-like superfamily)
MRIHFKSRQEWRRWLKNNHNKKKELWLIYYKKHTNVKTIPYNDAVEEALCFGWIDGQLKRIDNKKHMQRFTPRRERSVWAESNIKRVKKMISLGKMTKYGLEKFKHHEKTMVPTILSMPSDLKKELKKNKKAWGNFEKFPPSHKKHFFSWIFISKMKETRKRRIKNLVKRAELNKRLI